MDEQLTQLNNTDKAMLMGLFISKFDKRALNSFGFTSKQEVYNVFGYAAKASPNSIKLYKQEYDPYYPNGNQGFAKRKTKTHCLELMERFDNLSFDEFQCIVNMFVLDQYVDLRDIRKDKWQSKERKFMANRLLTGKAAEEYFVLNYQNITPFQNYLLTDTTNMGCGFDYKLSLNNDNYYVEVKGINERQGNILMTDKEHSMAEELLERYCLFVVCNFKKSPIHQMFFNPLYDERLLFAKQERQVTQISYTSNIIGV